MEGLLSIGPTPSSFKNCPINLSFENLLKNILKKSLKIQTLKYLQICHDYAVVGNKFFILRLRLRYLEIAIEMIQYI